MPTLVLVRHAQAAYNYPDRARPLTEAGRDQAARLGRRGALVIVDNVVRGGRIVDAEDDSAQVAGVRAGLAMLRDDPRFDATAVQTWDAKGWDGFALAVLV